jgi:hypothetical protein
MDQVHSTLASDQLVDALVNVARLADAKDPDPTSLRHVISPSSRREH